MLLFGISNPHLRNRSKMGSTFDFVNNLSFKRENKDLFAPGTVPSPGIQHLYNCLSHRALYPEDPVPHMADYLEDLLEPPESIMTQHEEIIQQVKSCFAIKDKQDTATSQNRG